MDFKKETEETSLKKVLNGFISQPDVFSRLQYIGNNELIGCEKWIQMELLKYLSEADFINDEIKEEHYATDKRTNDHRISQFIDLTFRLKNKKYYIALELKHKNSLALTDVNADFIKTNNIKPTQKVYFRKVYCLLIHPLSDEEYIIRKVENDDNFIGSFEFTLDIPDANLSFTVFSNQLT